MSENKAEPEQGVMVLINNGTFKRDIRLTKHDLGHIFASATGGTPNEETPAREMDALLSDASGMTYGPSSPYYSRSRVIKGLYKTAFGTAYNYAQEDQLLRVPMELFGMAHRKIGSHTHYAVRPVKQRKAFVDELLHVYEKNGLRIRVSRGALDKVRLASLNDWLIRLAPEQNAGPA